MITLKLLLFAIQAEDLQNDISADQAFPIENYQADLLKMFFTIVLLIGFLILTVWLFKRFIRSRMQIAAKGSAIQILEKRSISPKSILYLIEIEGEKFLISESQVQIQKIDSLKEHIQS